MDESLRWNKASDVRTNWSEVLQDLKEPLLIVLHSEPHAVLMSYDEYKCMRREMAKLKEKKR